MSFDPREAIAAGVRAHHEGRSLPQTEAEIADRVMNELTVRGYAVVKTQASKEALHAGLSQIATVGTVNQRMRAIGAVWRAMLAEQGYGIQKAASE